MAAKWAVDAVVTKHLNLRLLIHRCPIMKYLLPLLLFCLCLTANAQGVLLPNKTETEIDILSSYYNQDGSFSPVTGGIGTEELTDISNIVVVNVPLDSARSYGVLVGGDLYSSASTDNIDNNPSSASADDLRVYANGSYTQKDLQKGRIYSGRVGFSNEYDYVSVNGGLSLTQVFNGANSEITVGVQAFFDQWDIILPIELRTRNQMIFPDNDRRSFNGTLTFSQVLNRRAQFSLTADAIYMTGLLSTPFHRTFISEDEILRVAPEILPDERFKLPLSLRFNWFPGDRFIFRSYYRFYSDNWGITGHTASLEVPVKLSPVWTVYPYVRYHTQNASDYFAPFGEFSPFDTFRTSDYDLAALSSWKYGAGLRYAPINGLFDKIFLKRRLLLKYLQIRAAYYTRDPDLTAFITSLNLGFSLAK